MCGVWVSAYNHIRRRKFESLSLAHRCIQREGVGAEEDGSFSNCRRFDFLFRCHVPRGAPTHRGDLVALESR